MPPRIAIPMPHSTDLEYAQRAIPQYERAVDLAGGVPVRIPLDQTTGELKKLVASCDGVLVPGSKADVNPARFHQPVSPASAAADPRREEVDFFLLDDAYARRKPVLGICYGLQSFNVYRHGSLIQHIPDFVPPAARNGINHEAGKKVAVAHNVEIASDSNLHHIVNSTAHEGAQRELTFPVNSSHHQSADNIGEGLRIVARCPDDGIIEALEGTTSDHFVLAVQWHPERSVDQDEYSLKIFQALVQASK
jgi:putative glutamine amidotransferase